MKTVRVFFEQINYCYFDVKANTRAAAERKAIRLWKMCHKEPTVTAVQVVGDAEEAQQP